MTSVRVLLAGESWVSSTTHFKGWDFFSSTAYETGIEYLKRALSAEAGFDLVHLPSHSAAEGFPTDLEGLKDYDVVILSDLGANTLLLHPRTWARGETSPNRLSVLSQWVRAGGGLAMCGGYYSFSGIYGAAKYYRTAIEETLPVNIHTFDDRVETPEGTKPTVLESDHPILEGITEPWPSLLGFNELVVKPEGTLLAQVGDYPLLVAWEPGGGRSLAWASDIGPHWCPETFANWPGYSRLWTQAVEWLAQRR
jgi:uncharacterized membrane protein